MGIIEIALIGIGLAMDAFAVSICKGLSMKKINWKNTIIIALYFGLFQAIMPIIGYFLGATLNNIAESIDHWVAFILLSAIGVNMIKNSFDDEIDKRNDRVDFKTMIILAIESSCDETACAVVEMARGRRRILSNTVYSQIATHALYGGVVPEIASRAHIDAVSRVVG